MLAPLGFLSTELGDIEVVVHDGRLHAFHLCLPNHDRIAHWVSDDGIDWEARPDALRTGDAGSFDDDQLWTMSVTPHEGRFVMLYTALSRADGGRVQRIGRASSDDLERWTKDPEPVAVARAPHYETIPGRSAPWVAFRDPKPTAVEGGFAVVVTAQAPAGPPHRRGVIGHLRSDDLRTFTLEPPLFAPRRAFELECPQVVATDHGFVMLASLQDDRSIRWFHADALEGPWRTAGHSVLLPAPHYAARVFADAEGFGIASTYRYHDARGRLHHGMPTPLRLDLSQPGQATLRPWGPMLRRFHPEPEPLDCTTPCFDNATATREGSRFTVTSGEALWTSTDRHRDVRAQAHLHCEAPRFGLAFDLDADGSGWFVELEPMLRRARLIRRGHAPDPEGMPWFEHRVAQSATWLPGPSGGHALDLILLGPEVRLCIDDVVVLSAAVDRAEGTVGVWLESGQLDGHVTVMKKPD